MLVEITSLSAENASLVEEFVIIPILKKAFRLLLFYQKWTAIKYFESEISFYLMNSIDIVQSYVGGIPT